MKRDISLDGLLTGLLAMIAATGAVADDTPWEPGLPFETAVVQYQIKGAQNGTETLYIRDFGRERVKVTKSEGKMMFITTSTDTIEITTADEVVAIDMREKTGVRTTNPQKFVQEEIAKLSEAEKAVVTKNLQQIGMNAATQMGGKVEPKGGEHLGYACDVMTVAGTTSCTMSGTSILLKTESTLPGMNTETVATKFEKNVTIPADIFKVPADVKVDSNERADNINRNMIHEMIVAMKDPAAARKITEGLAQGREQMEQARRAAEEQQRQAAVEQAARDEGEQIEDSAPAEQDAHEMMDKGMKAFKGLFGK